ncbi:MAG: 50S ribosomal protein L9 [Bacteroidales bacterium]|mgnify:CR=1 FL=1|nr:50S ribosomal protein L9 [Bacteroidales bacterium]NCA76615.1 50S ribosomal protein L9 [Alphaproteobacteria bacterium]HNW74664.1 50S ribosomal protein L9 [Bacteroidales bacterium]HPS51683.1 50S ribosomal protein L9 [Bacteroidales bacterium]
MEVILKQDVLNLGYANEKVSVKPGYARNYLIPQGIAILATDSNKKMLAETLKQKAHKEAKIKKSAEDLSQNLKDIVVKIGAKAAESGKIFGSVNAIQIAQALKEQFNFDIDRKKIHVDQEHIKELGTYKAKIHLHKEVHIEITFEVFAE